MDLEKLAKALGVSRRSEIPRRFGMLGQGETGRAIDSWPDSAAA